MNLIDRVAYFSAFIVLFQEEEECYGEFIPSSISRRIELAVCTNKSEGTKNVMDKNDSVISSLLDSQQRLWQKYPTLASASAEKTALRETKNSVPKRLHDSCPIRGMRTNNCDEFYTQKTDNCLHDTLPTMCRKRKNKIYLLKILLCCRHAAAFVSTQNVVLCARGAVDHSLRTGLSRAVSRLRGARRCSPAACAAGRPHCRPTRMRRAAPPEGAPARAPAWRAAV